ncbi:hypothetical protein BKA93DRAFT_785195 [Sparassis latifolia]
MPSFSLLGNYLGIPALILFDSLVEKSALSSMSPSLNPTNSASFPIPHSVLSIAHLPTPPVIDALL